MVSPTGLSEFPMHVMEKILFQALNEGDEESVSRLSLVCKRWQEMVIKIYEMLNVKKFGQQEWEVLFPGFKINDSVSCPSVNFLNVAESVSRLQALDNKRPSISMILMPKGLTLNALLNLNPNGRQRILPLGTYWQQISQVFGDVPLESSYWCCITNFILDQTRDKGINEQVRIISSATKIAFHLPKIIEATACALLNYANDGSYYYGRDPHSKTRCEEWNRSQLNALPLHFTVGLFHDRQISIDWEQPFYENGGYGVNDTWCGVAACVRFMALNNLNKDLIA